MNHFELPVLIGHDRFRKSHRNESSMLKSSSLYSLLFEIAKGIIRVIISEFSGR